MSTRITARMHDPFYTYDSLGNAPSTLPLPLKRARSG